MELLRPAILGAMDGLITTFVIISSGLASETAFRSIVLIGFASLLSDGLSMGISETISSRNQDGISLWDAARRGAICMGAFLLFGVFPMAAFAGSGGVAIGRWVSIGVFALALLVLALSTASLSLAPWCQSLAETLGLGILAAGVAYGVASFPS